MKEKIYNYIVNNGINILQKVFPEYYAQEPLKLTDRHIEYPWVLEHIHLYKSPIKILDIGCSGSLFPLIVKSMGHDVWGIDIRDSFMEKKINFRKEDICLNSFESNTFDVITAISTIEHIGLEGRYGVKKGFSSDYLALYEIKRILKTNGLLLMTVPFGNKYTVGKFHRTYDLIRLNDLLREFTTFKTYEDSPEDNYRIALIKAVK